jgi:hypothetical protein
LKTKRIDEAQWVVLYVGIRIDPTLQPNGIALDVPANLRAVIAIVVVVNVDAIFVISVCGMTEEPVSLLIT